jgi:signal transduction histidine kinase
MLLCKIRTLITPNEVTLISSDSSETLPARSRTGFVDNLRQPVTATEMNVSAALRLLTVCVDDPASAKARSAFAEIGDALRDALLEQGRMRSALQVLEDLVRQREPVFVSVDAVALVQEMHLVTGEVSARHTVIELEIPSALPRIIADGVLVRQALLNIMMNALESTSASHSPAGPITITMCSDDAAGVVELVITHYGPQDEAVGTSERALALARAIAEVHDAL